MTTTELIRKHIAQIYKGTPFTNTGLLQFGSRASVDKALSRLVKKQEILRLTPGVFVRPKKSPFVGNVMPEIAQIINVIAKNYGETIQIHGAEAARQFKLSTQVPTTPVYNTSGLSRELKIGNLKIKLKHVSNRKLLLAGKRQGLALSALWYLGKNNVNTDVINHIQTRLTTAEFESLKNTNMPIWMTNAFEKYNLKNSHV
jgi:hypothetical protein